MSSTSSHPLSPWSPDVITFGCRLNVFESEVMRELAKLPADVSHQNDVLIVNTCAVTAEAERQARQAIRRAHRENPAKRIIVTGCAAQLRPESFAELPGVSYVLGNKEKTDPSVWQKVAEDLFARDPSQAITSSQTTPLVRVSDIMASDTLSTPQVVTSFDGMERAYVEIQNGCNHRCTFCTIPFGRGNNRSAPVAQIIKHIQALQNYKEVVLTGVDITDYGQDLPGTPHLGDLVRRLFVHVPSLQRLRLSSLDPVEIDPLLYTLIATEPRLMPHFHLSFQAGDPMILKRMKRRHSPTDIVECVGKIRSHRPEATFGADVIAGFPTETEAMFENTYNLIKDLSIVCLHVFPYSPRPDTPAARMPQVPGKIIKTRAAALRKLGDALKAKYMQQLVGTTQTALVENINIARTDTYMPVRFDDSTIKPGSIVTLDLVDYDEKNQRLMGKINSL